MGLQAINIVLFVLGWRFFGKWRFFANTDFTDFQFHTSKIPYTSSAAAIGVYVVGALVLKGLTSVNNGRTP